jgi:hypothetical protein
LFHTALLGDGFHARCGNISSNSDGAVTAGVFHHLVTVTVTETMTMTETKIMTETLTETLPLSG